MPAVALAAAGLLAVTGCSGESGGEAGGGGGAAAAFELLGTWTDDFGSPATQITDDRWGVQTIHAWDNAGNWAITQNPPDDQYGPDKYSRIVWIEPEGATFWWCTVAYGLDAEEDARNADDVSVRTDPENGGCGDYPWSLYTRASE